MTKKRILDYAVYVSIGLVLVASVFWMEERGVTLPARKWIFLVGESCVLFGYAIVDYRGYWKRLTFWAATLGLLAIHTCFFWVILIHVDRWSPLWFLLFFPFEFAGIDLALSALGFGVGIASRRQFRKKNQKNQ